MSAPEVVYIAADAGSRAPGLVVGGLTVLERKLLEAERAGARRAIVAWDGPLPARAMAMALAVERVAPGTPPPPGAAVVRADEVAGVLLDSEAARRRAEWQLLASLPKSFQGPVDALVNRHVSLRITRLLARTRVTPNMITTFALLIGLAATGLLATGRIGAIRVAGVLLFFQSVFDSCDGELARLRYQFSRLGQWLDNIADDVVDSAVAVGLGAAAGGATWVAVGVAAGAARVASQLVLYWQVRRAGGDFWKFRWWFETEVATLDQVYDYRSPLTWLRSLGRRDVYVFVWAVLCVAGAARAAALYAALLSAWYATITVVHLVKTAGR
jgi:phosphatidylglycerophosphate synthase